MTPREKAIGEIVCAARVATDCLAKEERDLALTLAAAALCELAGARPRPASGTLHAVTKIFEDAKSEPPNEPPNE